MERDINPLINLVYVDDKDNSVVLKTNISDIDFAPIEITCVSIDNLIKQSLISIPSSKCYTDEHIYDKLLNSPYYKAQQQNYPDTTDGFKFSHNKQFIEKTNLGNTFYKTCVVDL